MANAIYFNSLKGKQKKYGIGISGKVETIIEELKKHQNSKGYINLELKEKKQPDQYGGTHYLVVDTYEAKSKEDESLPF